MKILIISILGSMSLFGYIDSGTASMALQALIAGAAAVGYTMKIYWFKIKGFFGSDKSKDENDAEK